MCLLFFSLRYYLLLFVMFLFFFFNTFDFTEVVYHKQFLIKYIYVYIFNVQDHEINKNNPY